ncbi:divergent polysaccharide deacetylase family protein [Pikeienuella sp. HZG-20]|uniref:divergent polysaccharide deacetylase family protein n=1 Tax=Paludibacillus litoralis TaxID=3133267 RepID=UPI0030EE380E
MARGNSRRGAYWLGALFGLVVSGGAIAFLSIRAPLAPEAAVAPAGVEQEIPVADPAAPEVAPDAEAPEQAAPEVVTDAETPEPAAPEAKTDAEAPEPSAPEVETDAPAPAVTPAAPATETEARGAESADRPARPADDIEEKPAGETPAPAAPPADPAPAADSPDAEAAPTPAAPKAEAPGAPRHVANAAPFKGDAARPLLAIVLTGVGAPGDRELDEVMLLDSRIALALAPDAADPAALAARLRGAGFEVLAARMDASGAPDLAGPVLGAAFLTAPADAAGAVGALAPEGAALLDLTAIGGGALYREASKRRLPAAAAGARIDEIANGDLVYQALEQAASAAEGAGALVAVGALSPATLSGVRRWVGLKAGETVEVAPLSAVIRKLERR